MNISGESLFTTSTHCVTVIVPSEKVGRIIGVSGSTINSLRTTTGASIDLDKTNDGLGRVTILGEKENVDSAQTMIEALLRDGVTSQKSAAMCDDVVEVAGKLIGKVIGTAGSTIRGLRIASGARISIEKKPNGDGDIKLSGTAEQVRLAKENIESLLFDDLVDFHTERLTTITMDIPHRYVGKIIGHKGSVIEQLRAETGARIDVNNGASGTGEATIIAVGNQKALKTLKESINDIMTEFDESSAADNTMFDDCYVPASAPDPSSSSASASSSHQHQHPYFHHHHQSSAQSSVYSSPGPLKASHHASQSHPQQQLHRFSLPSASHFQQPLQSTHNSRTPPLDQGSRSISLPLLGATPTPTVSHASHDSHSLSNSSERPPENATTESTAVSTIPGAGVVSFKGNMPAVEYAQQIVQALLDGGGVEEDALCLEASELSVTVERVEIESLGWVNVFGLKAGVNIATKAIRDHLKLHHPQPVPQSNLSTQLPDSLTDLCSLEPCVAATPENIQQLLDRVKSLEMENAQLSRKVEELETTLRQRLPIEPEANGFAKDEALMASCPPHLGPLTSSDFEDSQNENILRDESKLPKWRDQPLEWVFDELNTWDRGI